MSSERPAGFKTIRSGQPSSSSMQSRKCSELNRQGRINTSLTETRQSRPSLTVHRDRTGQFAASSDMPHVSRDEAAGGKQRTQAQTWSFSTRRDGGMTTSTGILLSWYGQGCEPGTGLASTAMRFEVEWY